MSSSKHLNGSLRANGDERKEVTHSGGVAVSELGRHLRELSDKALASGTSRLTNKQIHQLVAEIRGRS